MSIFRGRDNNGNNHLHITNGVTPVSSFLTGQVLANTVFHSDLPYLEVEEYKLIRNNANRLEAPIEFINAYNNANPYFITVDGTLENHAMDLFMYKWNNGSNLTQNYPNHTYKYINKKSNTDSNFVYIIKNISNRNYVPFVPMNNEIKTGNGEFNIKGKNLNITKYIQNGVMNLVDRQFFADKTNQSSSRKLQIINSVNPTNGTLEISSDPSESYIARNDIKVFSSLVNHKSKYKEKTSAVIQDYYHSTPNLFTGCGSNIVIPDNNFFVGVQASGFIDGDLFIVDWEANNSGIYDAGVYKYRQGHIGYPAIWDFSISKYGYAETPGRVLCCYLSICSDCYDGDSYEDCWFDGGYVCGGNDKCEQDFVVDYAVNANWEIRGNNGNIELWHNAVYTIISDPCFCSDIGSSDGIFFTYSSRYASLKFY